MSKEKLQEAVLGIGFNQVTFNNAHTVLTVTLYIQQNISWYFLCSSF